jgi:antitoxin HicB
VRTYTIMLTPDHDEGGFVVSVPALPGCFTQGDTLEEALANAREAITVHVLGLLKDGEPVPEETEQPLLIPVKIDVPVRSVA